MRERHLGSSIKKEKNRKNNKNNKKKEKQANKIEIEKKRYKNKENKIKKDAKTKKTKASELSELSELQIATFRASSNPFWVGGSEKTSKINRCDFRVELTDCPHYCNQRY